MYDSLLIGSDKMGDDGSENLRAFVERVMHQKGLSIREVQEHASRKGPIAASYISRIITGKVRNLSVDRVVALAEGLGVNPFEFLLLLTVHNL